MRDLARLETSRPSVVLQRLAWELERASVALPMMAVCMLAPLTLHAVVYGVIARPEEPWFFANGGFGTWIALSVILVGHVHVALVVWCWKFAAKARRMPTEELAMRSHGDWASALGVAFFCSLVPGVVLVALPPLLVAVTGLAFLPAMFTLMRRRLLAERRAIEA